MNDPKIYNIYEAANELFLLKITSSLFFSTLNFPCVGGKFPVKRKTNF